MIWLPCREVWQPFYISQCEMTPASIGGGQQISLSGGT